MPISIGTKTSAAVFGYGVEGRSAAAWLRTQGCKEIRVISAERPDDLDPSTPWAAETDARALAGVDLLVKSPGIKPSHALLARAAEEGIPVTSATRAVRRAGARGGTGRHRRDRQQGKVHHRDADPPHARKGGDPDGAGRQHRARCLGRPRSRDQRTAGHRVRDVELPDPRPDRGPLGRDPDATVPEHLDWHGSLEAYYAAKLNIAATQRHDGVTIWNAHDPELARRAPFGPARHVPYGEVYFDVSHMKLRGEHNRRNAAAALAAVKLFGARSEHLESVLATFEGLPHRLEDLGIHAGVRWINDSIATAPEAAVAALEAFEGEVATYIGGGTDRGFDYAPLAEALVAHAVESVILLPPGGPRIGEALAGRELRGSRVHAAGDLAEAVALAVRLTRPGGTVLFSPASPSYGVFRNFEERGDTLRALVSALA
jgi:UDP-N-acetylmuramoylalanine--D-glutamate ligase